MSFRKLTLVVFCRYVAHTLGCFWLALCFALFCPRALPFARLFRVPPWFNIVVVYLIPYGALFVGFLLTDIFKVHAVRKLGPKFALKMEEATPVEEKELVELDDGTTVQIDSV